MLGFTPTLGQSRVATRWQFWDSHLGVPWKNAIWMWASWRGTKYTIRGKVVASPKSKLWWVLWVRIYPWLVLAPIVFQLCTNHLVLVLCKFVWVVEACQFFLVRSQSSSTPLYPFKVLRVREHASTPYSSVVFSLDSHLSPSRSWERAKYNSGNSCCMNFFLTLCFLGLHLWFILTFAILSIHYLG